ncbi:MAG: hypothetical protein WCH77_08110 [Planctomycetota bacterium]
MQRLIDADAAGGDATGDRSPPASAGGFLWRSSKRPAWKPGSRLISPTISADHVLTNRIARYFRSSIEGPLCGTVYYIE